MLEVDLIFCYLAKLASGRLTPEQLSTLSLSVKQHSFEMKLGWAVSKSSLQPSPCGITSTFPESWIGSGGHLSNLPAPEHLCSYPTCPKTRTWQLPGLPSSSRAVLRVPVYLKCLQMLHTLVLPTNPQARINLQSPAVSDSPCLCILSFYQ